MLMNQLVDLLKKTRQTLKEIKFIKIEKSLLASAVQIFNKIGFHFQG